jgi:hypothetical protein
MEATESGTCKEMHKARVLEAIVKLVNLILCTSSSAFFSFKNVSNFLMIRIEPSKRSSVFRVRPWIFTREQTWCPSRWLRSVK